MKKKMSPIQADGQKNGLGRVAVGMSGGVDSSLSASLLKEQGYEVTGVFLECWRGPGCRAEEDRKDALDVALELGVPFEVLDFRQEYKQAVVDYFYREYKAGRTPNPDVMCNKEIKFGMFYDWAMKQGFDYVATGHYARVGGDKAEERSLKEEARKNSGIEVSETSSRLIDDGKAGLRSLSALSSEKMFGLKLMRGVDEKKDQSYFLYRLREEQLEHILFPIGHLTKPEVRQMAKEHGLAVADKPDSQGICFIGEVSVVQFLKDLGMQEKEGEVVMSSAKNLVEEYLVVGRHKGAWFYTIGQRLRGLQVTSDKEQVRYQENLKKLGFDLTNMQPLYILKKDVEQNRLIVGEREKLFCRELELEEVHFISEEDSIASLQNDKNLSVRIRHGGELVPVDGFELSDDRLKLRLEKPVFGVAPGQAVVFYQGEVCLGGGTIT